MNASYAWLKAFVDFPQTPAQLRELLTMHVATVDDLVSLRSDLANIVVARVVEEGLHPDSDHLHVTKVDMGTGELLDVVCGAPNVTAGKLYPFAPTGTIMPNGLKIEKRKIRGQVSNGMICSARELGLGDDHEGVMELNLDVPLGTPFLKAMPIGDTQLVIDVLANRPDLLSHLGIAREISALTRKPMEFPKLGLMVPNIAKATPASRSGMAGPMMVTVGDASLAKRFMGVVVRGVKVGPSPQWLVDRLASVGSRSINNVVDASNYVLHELGQPTHAFDLKRLGGGQVQCRLAKAGETVRTLDGVDRKLTAETIVIADETRARAIAGIMGGEDSEVTNETTDLFIEVANFDPARIRSARRALGMSSDASYRFERGVDVDLAPVALERVTQIIIGLAGGEVDGNPIDIRNEIAGPRQIALRTSRVTQVLGDEIPTATIDRYLSGVGFQMKRGDAEHGGALVPSWRMDVVDEIDLVEEVARLHGYDNFAEEIRLFRASTVPDDEQWLVGRRIRDFLVAQGLFEVKPLPFVAAGETHVRVKNPLAENEGGLRGGIVETLARRVEANLAHMQRDIRLFEVGNVFGQSKQALPDERVHVAAVLLGRREPRHFTDVGGDEFDKWMTFDRWDAAALAEEVARIAFGSDGASLEPAMNAAVVAGTLHPDWFIKRNGKQVGTVGRIAVDAPIWAATAWGFELTLGDVDSTAPAARGKNAYVGESRSQVSHPKFSNLPTTPAAEFDLALVLAADQKAADVERVIRASAGELLEKLELFDQYMGKGMRSVAWRLTLRHPERTLKDKEIDGRRAKILSALEKELNVRPRTS